MKGKDAELPLPVREVIRRPSLAQERLGSRLVTLDQAAAPLMQRNRFARPNRPVTQQSTDNSSLDNLAVVLEAEGR